MVELALATPSNRPDGPGDVPVESSIIVEKRGNHSAFCKWNISSFAHAKQKTLWSKYFEVGGYDCRLLVYPTGDSQALPGYVSVYLQISDPGNNNSKWDCFASYRLSVRNLVDDNKSVHRDSWHRFSAKKKSHGWCDFAALTTVLDPKQGFLGPGDTIQISTDITILHESVTFTRESDLSGAAPSATGDVYSGKFVWRVHNFSAFQPLLKTQKIMSPGFPAGDCLLRLSVYQSTVSSTDYLSVCLESKDTEKAGPSERTCWCLFRLAVTSQLDTGRQVHKDSYGRFAADSKAGDNTSLGWNDFMRMSDFMDQDGAYLVEDTAVFSTTFHVIREYTSLTRNLEARAAQSAGQMARYKEKRKLVARESDFAGKFTWRIEHFTRLKDLLKKRKITGLCIKSKRFTIGGRDCRLIVYPRGQSQPPTYLSMFLEVCDPRAPSPDWTCFVSHRLAVVNQRAEADKSIGKESQNRYSKTAKDWGWREFVSLTTLFDADAGFLVNDAVVFAAEVLVLRESCDIRHLPLLPSEVAAAGTAAAPTGTLALAAPPAPTGVNAPDGELPVSGRPPSAQGESPLASTSGGVGAVLGTAGSGGGVGGGVGEAGRGKTVFTWRIENFQAFKDIMETRKIFSRFFSVGPCELRIGLYESFESLCLYLESNAATAPPSQQAGPTADATSEKPPNYWVRYRMAVLNQRHPEKTEWKEAAICTRSWNNSVLQFTRVPPSSEGDAGYVLRDSLAITCEVLECCPWLDFAEGDLGPANANGPPVPGHSSAAAATDKALSLTDGGDSDVDEDDVYTDEEGESEDDEGESDVDIGDDEDALSGWLASAGVQLSGGEAPPVIADPSLVRRALAATLLHQPGAIPMFVASLRMYMDTLAKVKCLLMPCQSADVPADSPLSRTSKDTAATGANGSSLMHVLMALPQLQQPLLGMLLDVMLDHCLTARMHKHHLQKVQEAAAAATAAEEERGEDVRGAGGARSPPSPSGSVDSRHVHEVEEGGQDSSGYISSEESSYEDAFEVPNDAPAAAAGHWADDVLQAAQAAAAAAATGAPSSQQKQQQLPPEQRPPNGVLRGLIPLPPRKQQQQAAVAAAAASPASHPADLAGPPAVTPAAEEVAAEAARHDEPGDAADVATDLEEGTDLEGEGSGLCPSVCEVEQVVAVILGFLRGLDPALFQPLPAKTAGAGGGAVIRAPLSSLQKVSMLLADAPRALQPDIIMLVPRLVDPSEHTAAAGTLLGRLAEASREGADAEGKLRMPVLAALGMLHIDPAVADKVLHAALEALPCLSESELPPAVGLVLKLASESDVAQALAVRVVRQRIRAAAGACSAGALDAVRLAVLQHRDVARAMLADIESDAREALALTPETDTSLEAPPALPDVRHRQRSSSNHSLGSRGDPSPMQQPGEAAPGPATVAAAVAAAAREPPEHLLLQVCDVEVLLDLLSLPELQREAAHAIELSAAGGILHEANLAALVERRRLQQLVASSLHSAAPRMQTPPASPASSSVAGDEATWRQQAAAAGAVLGEGSSAAMSNVFPREDITAMGMQPPSSAAPPASANLVSALSLLEESQGGLGRLGPVGSAAPMHLPPLPSLAAVLPPQQQQQQQQAVFSTATAVPSLAAAAAAAASLPLPPISTAAPSDEFGGLLSLAESLQVFPSHRCHNFALVLFRTLFRLYCDDASRRRLLRGLVFQTLGHSLPAQQQQLQSQPQPLARSASSGASGSRPPSASASSAGSAGGAAGPGTPAARLFAEELLASLLAEHPEAARLAVGLSLEAAKAAAQQSDQVLQQLAATEVAAAREVSGAREEAARQSASKNRYIERAAELNTQLTRLKAEHRAELAGVASDKKELLTQIRHLEMQLEWVRSERDEERANKSKEGREAAQRASEVEAQLNRLKGQRREDQKRWQKEKASLAEKVKELEERQKDSEQEATRLRSEASTATYRHDKAAADLKRRSDAVEKLVAERETELGKMRAATLETEAKLRAHQDAVRKLERRLSEEVSRSATVVHGVGVEGLGLEELEALGRVHEQGLKRVNQALAKRGRAPVGGPLPLPSAAEPPLTRSASPAISGGAPTPAPSAAASPIDVSKAAFRSGMPQHSHSHQGHHASVHHQALHGGLRGPTGPSSPAPLSSGLTASAAASLQAQLQSLSAAAGASGPTTSGNPPRRPLRLNSSLDSLQSLGGVGSTSSLFSGPWGSAHSMAALQQAAAAAASNNAAAGRRAAGQAAQGELAASAAMDAANMEKLMGLLPSDLLHS